jgi:hypothetical protein
MAYSVDNETKIATYNGDEFAPKIIWTDTTTKTIVALTEEECAELETIRAAQPSEADVLLNDLRVERNRKLAETDWTQSRDVTLTNDADWATYRQALRDITDTYSDLDSVVWPTKPE